MPVTRAGVGATVETSEISDVVLSHTAGGSTVGLKPREQGIVLAPGSSGQWDENMVAGPSVWWDENAQRWGMVYVGYSLGTLFAGASSTGFGRIGLAWSDDLVTWTRDAGNPIYDRGAAAQPDDGSLTAPFMYYESGTYYLFYLGCSDPGYENGTKTLMLATAAATATGPPTSNASWTRRGSISPGSAPSWCANAIWHANVVKSGGTYHLFVNGTAADTLERIGHATATSPLGPWTYDSAATLDVGAGGAFDDTHVADPWVYRLGDRWYMHYAGVNSTLATKEGLASTTVSAFPSGWTKHAGNPNVSVWSKASFNGPPDYTGGRPCVIVTEHGHYHFYTREWPEQIGLSVLGGAGYETIAGGRRRQWQPSDNKLLLATIDPGLANSAATLTDGFLVVARIWVPETVVVANLVIHVVVAGTTLVSGQCLGAIYKQDKTLIAKTATQHASWNSTGTKTMALTAESGQSLRLPGGPGVWIYGALLSNSGAGTDTQVAAVSNAALNACNINLADDTVDGFRTAFKGSGLTAIPSPLGALGSSLAGPAFMGLT